MGIFVVTMAVIIDSDDENTAETAVNAEMDKLANNGSDIRSHDVLEVREATSRED